jgi:hypothetical protein
MTNATKLNNGYSEPMIVTFGMYSEKADCTGGNRLDLSKQFIGSVDEFHIFSRELQQDEIQQLILDYKLSCFLLYYIKRNICI